MDDIRTQLEAAAAANNKGNFDEAEAIAKKILLHEEYSLSEKAKTLAILVISLWQRGFAEEALPYAQESLQIFRNNGDRSGEAKTLASLGNIYRLLYDNKQAVEYQSQSLALYKELADVQGIAVCYSNLGLLYSATGEHQQALEAFFASLSLFEDINDDVQQAKILSSIGATYKNSGDFSRALEYLLKALDCAIQHDLHDVIGACLANISSIYISLADFPLALDYAYKALQHYEQHNNPVRLAICLHTLGSLYVYLSDYTRALEYQTQALEKFKSVGHKEGILAVLNSIANIYLVQSLFQQAIPYYQEALEIATDVNKQDAILSVLSNLGIALYQIGEHDQALLHYEKALQIANIIDNLEKTASLLVNMGDLFADNVSHLYQPEKAEECALQAIDISRKIGLKNIEADALKVLSPLYRAKKQWEQADSTFQQFYAIEKEILSNEHKKLADGYAYKRQIAVMEKEREVTDFLLHKFLPSPIIPSVKEKGGKVVVKHYESLSVMFADVVGFTKLSLQVPPAIMIELLDSIFTAFDSAVKNNGGHRLRTMGDGYFAICGAPDFVPEHQMCIAKAALQMQQSLIIPTSLEKYIPDNTKLRVRIGLHCGPAVCGLVGGLEKWQYDAYGDTINTASRMESHGEAGEIHCSEDFKNALASSNLFTFIPRPPMEVKSKGVMQTYFLQQQ